MSKSSQTLSPRPTNCSHLEELIRERIPDGAIKIFDTFHPSFQAKYSMYPERCVAGKAPTLTNLKVEFGEKVPLNWLLIQINDFNNYIGLNEQRKNSAAQMQEMAKMIMSRYHYLKITEIMLFFQKLKFGDYGEMYGNVDPMKILKALRDFMDYRADVLMRVESALRQKEMEEHKKRAMSREQWLEYKNNNRNSIQVVSQPTK